MKIIVSHDVDHLYPSDHIFRDLIFPKLWVRSSIEILRGKINLKTWFYRLISIFEHRMNQIPEIIEFDKMHDVPSTFFFGMDNILGMSYKKEAAKHWIIYVKNNNFDVGVHGVNIENMTNMKQEYFSFAEITGMKNFGIRTHYVRYNETTFNKMAKIGYLFDSSEFNKTKIELKSPYKIDEMWEFPLHIMDSYVMKNGLDEAKKNTIIALEQASTKGIEYFTFLFHDYLFNQKTYPKDKAYYEWFISYCKEKQYPFVSYRDAINELNRYGQ